MVQQISQRGIARDWLTARLAEGEVESKVLKAEAYAALKLSDSTLLKAADELNIISESRPGKFKRETWWRLP